MGCMVVLPARECPRFKSWLAHKIYNMKYLVVFTVVVTYTPQHKYKEPKKYFRCYGWFGSNYGSLGVNSSSVEQRIHRHIEGLYNRKIPQERIYLPPPVPEINNRRVRKLKSNSTFKIRIKRTTATTLRGGIAVPSLRVKLL